MALICGVDFLNARQECADDSFCGQFAAADALCQLGGGRAGDPRSSQHESVTQLVGRVDEQFVDAADVRRAGDLWDDGGMRAKGRGLDYLAGEAGAQDALDDEGFTEPDLAGRSAGQPALTPVPVGEAVDPPSANMQTLRLWCCGFPAARRR